MYSVLLLQKSPAPVETVLKIKPNPAKTGSIRSTSEILLNFQHPAFTFYNIRATCSNTSTTVEISFLFKVLGSKQNLSSSTRPTKGGSVCSK